MKYQSFNDLLQSVLRNEELNPVAMIDNDAITILTPDYEEVLYQSHPYELMQELLSALGISSQPV